MPPQIPHLAFPVRLDRDRFAVVEQDSSEHVDGCAEAAIRCPEGWLDHNESLGLPDLAFTVPAIDRPALVRAAAEQGHPDADALTDEQINALTATVTATLGAARGDE